MEYDQITKTYTSDNHGDGWKFEKYVGRCAVNGYSIAKYTDDNDMVLLQIEGPDCSDDDSASFNDEAEYLDYIDDLYEKYGFIENSGTTVSMLIKELDSKNY